MEVPVRQDDRRPPDLVTIRPAPKRRRAKPQPGKTRCTYLLDDALAGAVARAAKRLKITESEVVSLLLRKHAFKPLTETCHQPAR